MRTRHAAVLLLALACPVLAFGKRAPDRQPLDRLLGADVVVIGTVASIEKETVEADLNGAKATYTVASVKVDASLLGAKNVTHVKVGFVANGQPSRYGSPQLAEGEKACVFLVKHPDAGFYVMHWTSMPVDVTDANKDVIDQLKAAAAVLNDPVKALKAEKAEDRAKAAAVLVRKYRAQPDVSGGEATEQVAIPAEESALILKGLGDGEWARANESGVENPLQAFYTIGLTDKDGWANPQPKPGEDAAALTQKAFVKWLDGPGAKYQFKKFVRKAK